MQWCAVCQFSLWDAESRVHGLITCFLNYSYSLLAEVRSACFDNCTMQLWKTSLTYSEHYVLSFLIVSLLVEAVSLLIVFFKLQRRSVAVTVILKISAQQINNLCCSTVSWYVTDLLKITRRCLYLARVILASSYT